MLPTVSLNKLLHVKTSQLQRVDNRWVTHVQHKPISVFSLAHLLEMEYSLGTSQGYDGILIVADAISDISEIILLVDEIIGEHDCVIKPLPMPLDSLPYLAGATLNEEGHLTLALNTKDLIQKASTAEGFLSDFGQSSEDVPKENVVTPKSQLRNILVVDDAITTRSLSVSALQAAGYNTVEAINGEQAWEVLQDTPVDCIVTDIEMPKMTGFELIDMIKKHENFAKLPVVIVSCLNKPKDKARGLALGANAYLVKKDFDTRILIKAVENLL